MTDLSDRAFLLRHIDEFRNEVLGDLSQDEIMSLISCPLEFGWNVRSRFGEWREGYEADADQQADELAARRRAWQRERT